MTKVGLLSQLAGIFLSMWFSITGASLEKQLLHVENRPHCQAIGRVGPTPPTSVR
jgi:hypothetical protein